MILTIKTFQDRRLKLIVTGLEVDFDTCIFQFMEYEDATKLRFWAYLWKCCNAKISVSKSALDFIWLPLWIVTN